MAKKPTDNVRLVLEVELKLNQIAELDKMVEVPEGATLSEVQKIRDLAEDMLTQVAAGGVLFSPDEVKEVLDATGVQLSTASELIPYITEEAGMEDGKHRVTVLIDPALYPAYEELALTQERTVDEIMQEVVEQIQADEWIYELRPRPKTVLMTESDAAVLKELLGADFSTGTELAGLIRNKLEPAAPTVDDLFPADEEPVSEPSNVGAQG